MKPPTPERDHHNLLYRTSHRSLLFATFVVGIIALLRGIGEWLFTDGLDDLSTMMVIVSAIALLTTCTFFLNNLWEIQLGEERVFLRDGFDILTGRRRSIRYDYIHTIRLVPATKRSRFHPTSLTLIYRNPTLKMMHVELVVRTAGIPDVSDLLKRLIERSNPSSIRLGKGGLKEERIDKEEAMALLNRNKSSSPLVVTGKPDGPVSRGSSEGF